MKCIIYDFETLGQNPKISPALALAALAYDEDKFIDGDGYTYQELLNRVKIIKFDIADQIKNYEKVIQKETMDWWQSQSPEARQILKPTSQDVSITNLEQWLTDNFGSLKSFKKVFTRGNTFDPIFLMELVGYDPFNWWCIRDTRSYIDGMLIGDNTIDNKFIPEQYKDVFIAHDPSHDIVMDVMRMQTLIRAILL